MSAWHRDRPVLAGALGGAVLVALGLGFWGYRLGAEREDLARALLRERATWEAVAAAPLVPTADNLAAARFHRAELERVLDRLRSSLMAGTQWEPTPAFGGAEDIYFDLVSMVEAQRRAYRAAGIALEDDEQFGYGQVLRDQQVRAPAGFDDAGRLAWTAAMHRQRQALGAALDALRAGAPTRLLAVERTALGPTADPRAALPEDVFTPDQRLSVAVPGLIETSAVRLVFEGRTEALRDFLAALRAAPRPLVVRSIEVEPATGANRGRARTATPAPASPFAVFARPTPPPSREAAADDGAVPIVAANDSVFTVVLEAYHLVPPVPAGEGGA